MTNAANGQPVTNPHCWSCTAAIGPIDRFCRACGAKLMPDASQPREPQKNTSRRNAIIMFLFAIVILLFAVVHRDPADIILVVAFALPLCGVGAITWRMA
jgi:predicted nucleic acid-binding Zn ribbon protein